MAKLCSLWDERKFMEHPLNEAAKRLLLSSNYAAKQIKTLQKLLQEDDCLSALTQVEYTEALSKLPCTSETEFSIAIREFRHYHFLRLLLREMAKLANTEETMRSWSHCADALICRTLSYCELSLHRSFGIPYEESGRQAKLYVLAMGKLGGQELNYSSDIDLIFAYSACGFTSGDKAIPNENFYTKVVQLFIQLMQTVRKEGFVFRVDLRLRPNGESGALVCSLAFMETYYQEQGRDWERYAMVKARLISGSENDWVQRILTPFVYRRYIDFGVIESLRVMKAMIERELQLNQHLNDIKRGLGGIREIEFIIQNIQLIRGGRLPELRKTNALAALQVIQQKKLLPHCARLRKAYLFLRKLENCLQADNDQQTHELPTESSKQANIALAMNYSSWDLLEKQLASHRQSVSTLFRNILKRVDYEEDSQRLISTQLMSIWQGHVETSLAVNLLASFGYQRPQDCYQLIYRFRHSPRCRRLTQAARLRLDRFMVALLNELIYVTNTEEVLFQVINLLENIVARSAYLALLTENPPVLRELVHWFSLSPFISSLIVAYPFLLEILLAEKKSWYCPSRKELEQQLERQLSYCEEDEAREEQLRQFKLTQWLLVARAELYGFVQAQRVGQFLADVADVIVKQVVKLAYQLLKSRHPTMKGVLQQFAILAYGKLGSREMNYDSDLDLVFIHTQLNQEQGVIRLTQKIMHMLTTRLHFGFLYQVDTRLRPSGAAGLLVSTLEAFEAYQKSQAWTWEHQALIKARVLMGPLSLRRSFLNLKQTILSETKEKTRIACDVQTMLEKLKQRFNGQPIKYSPGGLLELEFLIQYLILVNPDVPILGCTHMLKLLQRLRKFSKISEKEWKILSKAYRAYHRLLHQQIILLNPHPLAEKEQAKVHDIALYYFQNK